MGASMTLVFLMGAFLICWLPFFIWMGYVNSAVNPLIYALHHSEFKQVFAEYWRSCISFFFFCNTREEPLPETDSQQMRMSSSTSSKAKRPSVAITFPPQRCQTPTHVSSKTRGDEEEEE